MDLSKIKESLKRWILNANDKGLPVPMVRDPDKDSGSITATMAVVSFGFLLLGLSSKFIGIAGEIKMDEAMQVWIWSMGFYLGRKMPGMPARTKAEREKNAQNSTPTVTE